MTVCRDDRLRRRPALRPRARTNHARVAGPLALSLSVQTFAVLAAVALGLSTTAVLGVVLVIAAVTAVVSRRTIGSLVAGAGIRVAQPYEPGEQIRVFVPSLGSVVEAEIVRVGPANTTLMTHDGMVLVPNARMLRGTARAS